jgi:hypothetical protein
MAWICLQNDDYRNSQFCVVTGPNQDIAIKLIKRMKALFEAHNIMFDSKETVLELKCLQNRSVSFKLYWRIQSPRQSQVHLTRWSRFFQKEWTRRYGHVSERYIPKSYPYNWTTFSSHILFPFLLFQECYHRSLLLMSKQSTSQRSLLSYFTTNQNFIYIRNVTTFSTYNQGSILLSVSI